MSVSSKTQEGLKISQIKKIFRKHFRICHWMESNYYFSLYIFPQETDSKSFHNNHQNRSGKKLTSLHTAWTSFQFSKNMFFILKEFFFCFFTLLSLFFLMYKNLWLIYMLENYRVSIREKRDWKEGKEKKLY